MSVSRRFHDRQPASETPPAEDPAPGEGRGLATRARSKLFVVILATLLGFYLCYRLAQPVFPALVWAVTVAVISHPLLRRLRRHIQGPGLCAGVATAVVALALLIPISGLVLFAAFEIGNTLGSLENPENLARWQQQLLGNPRIRAMWQWAAENLAVGGEAQAVAARIRDAAVRIVSGSLYTVVQTLLTLFVLFYLYRDQNAVLSAVRRISPLSTGETNRLLERLRDTVYATVFGIVAVAAIQGALGGLMFWMLGLPAAVFWGIVMAVLAIIPYLGAFVVWVPAAAWLASQGDWGKALILTAWGTIVVGLIDNLVYPIFVGDRLRQHTLIAFIAIVGGIMLFGATGLILGPVTVTATLFLLDVWRQRTAFGAAAEQSA